MVSSDQLKPHRSKPKKVWFVSGFGFKKIYQSFRFLVSLVKFWFKFNKIQKKIWLISVSLLIRLVQLFMFKFWLVRLFGKLCYFGLEFRLVQFGILVKIGTARIFC